MERIKKNFGFGCMRLPMKDGEVDTAQVSRMVDTFLANGFNYFDTAHGYLGGKSETALKACLTDYYQAWKPPLLLLRATGISSIIKLESHHYI